MNKYNDIVFFYFLGVLTFPLLIFLIIFIGRVIFCVFEKDNSIKERRLSKIGESLLKVLDNKNLDWKLHSYDSWSINVKDTLVGSYESLLSLGYLNNIDNFYIYCDGMKVYLNKYDTQILFEKGRLIANRLINSYEEDILKKINMLKSENSL